MLERDETTVLLVESATAFVAEHAALKSTDADRRRGMTELGWTGLLLPENVGGVDLGISQAAALLEVLSAKLFAGSILTGTFIPSILLRPFLDRSRAHALASELASGQIEAPLAWQERPGQIDLGRTAVKAEGGRLVGTKLFIPDIAMANAVLVTAMLTSTDLAVIALPLDRPGIKQSSFEMGDGSRSAHLSFDRVDIDSSDIIATGSEAARSLEIALRAGTLLRAAQLSALAFQTFNSMVDYLKQRRQFDQNLSSFQVLRHRAVDLYAQARMANASWHAALGKFGADPLAAETCAAISAAKARCNDAANTITKAAIQMHGAFGFTEDSGLGRALNSALAWSASFGNSDTHRAKFFAIGEQDAAA